MSLISLSFFKNHIYFLIYWIIDFIIILIQDIYKEKQTIPETLKVEECIKYKSCKYSKEIELSRLFLINIYRFISRIFSFIY